LAFWEKNYDGPTCWVPLRLSWGRRREEIWSAEFGLYLSWTLPAPRYGPQGRRIFCGDGCYHYWNKKYP